MGRKSGPENDRKPDPKAEQVVVLDAYHPFLDRLAERVRTARARRGMSRKALARYAQISERYLAQLEAGRGNISVLLLRRVARALSVPLAEIIDDRPERPLEATLLNQLLERLPLEDWKAARELLLERFGPPSGADRDRRIALIGLRGSGKSTLGLRLAERLDFPFVDLDREIEKISGMRLTEMFEMYGQETFRRTEREALEATLQAHPRVVIATGGGLVTEPATFELLLSSCVSVWVRASPDEHMQRVIAQGDLRPMADNARAMDDLVAILRSREALYAKADLVLDTSGRTPDQSVHELRRLLGGRRGAEKPHAVAGG